MGKSPFKSFFMGGFECSTHRPRHGKRLDLIASTRHDRFVVQDYHRLKTHGLHVARDGIRWHLIEKTPYRYDFSSVLPMVRAAHNARLQIIWDLCHYGWPDDLDIFSTEFVRRYASMAAAFAKFLSEETDEEPLITPINEISYFAWAAGMVGYIHPYVEGRGDDLKQHLVRAAIEGIEAIWNVSPGARIVHADPVINVVADPGRPQDKEEARNYTRSYFQSWDMLCGRTRPELGGDMKYLDIVGINYYPHNQWVFTNLPFNPAYVLEHTDPLYRPFRSILQDVYSRYRRPLCITETGANGEERPTWLRYVGKEVRAAMQAGVEIEGICLYPIVNFPHWDDNLPVNYGLWGFADQQGERPLYDSLARELRKQQRLFARLPSYRGELDEEEAA